MTVMSGEKVLQCYGLIQLQDKHTHTFYSFIANIAPHEDEVSIMWLVSGSIVED